MSGNWKPWHNRKLGHLRGFWWRIWAVRLFPTYGHIVNSGNANIPYGINFYRHAIHRSTTMQSHLRQNRHGSNGFRLFACDYQNLTIANRRKVEGWPDITGSLYAGWSDSSASGLIFGGGVKHCYGALFPTRISNDKRSTYINSGITDTTGKYFNTIGFQAKKSDSRYGSITAIQPSAFHILIIIKCWTDWGCVVDDSPYIVFDADAAK